LNDSWLRHFPVRAKKPAPEDPRRRVGTSVGLAARLHNRFAS